MNAIVLYGKLLTLPKISIIQVEKKSILVGKFVVGCIDKNRLANFFECIAFGNIVRIIKKNFVKGSCITISGSMKNFNFQDINKTSHYTNVILVEQIDSAEKEYVLVRENISLITKELYEECNDCMEKCYQKVCENGFLCINEDDYYDIATSNLAMN